MSKSAEVRQDGLLYIDRDKAVEKHLAALRTMVRPGTIQVPTSASDAHVPLSHPNTSRPK